MFFQENLDSFLAIAEELQLKGLMGKTNENEVETEKEKPKTRKFDKVYKQESYQRPSVDLRQAHAQNQIAVAEHGTSVTTMATKSIFSEDLQELDNQLNSIMVKTLRKTASSHPMPLYQCTLCGKEAVIGVLKKHIEANHLEGISVPCNQCEKTFRSRHALAMHNRRHHNTSKHSDLF